MNPPSIFTASPENRNEVMQTLVMGFSADPLARWFWPEAHTYVQSAPGFDAFGGPSLDSGTTFVTEHYGGVALWMPPGVEQWGFGEAFSAFLAGYIAMTISWPPVGRWAAGYGKGTEALNWIPETTVADTIGYALPPGGRP